MSSAIYRILAPPAVNILCAVLALIGPLFSASLGYYAYRGFFLSGLVVYVSSLYRSGLLRKDRIAEVMHSSDGPFLVFFAMFLILRHHSFPLLIPQTILSVLVCSYLLSLRGTLHDSLPPPVKAGVEKINSMRSALVVQAALLEVVNGFILVPLTCPLTTTAAYWFFLRLRYAEDGNCRLAFNLLRRQVEGLAAHPRVPGVVKGVVEKVTTSLAGMAPVIAKKK